MDYARARDRREAAYAQYNAASHWLELETIKERLAEIQSQHEPLASLINESRGERERLYAAAYYVVVGRMPEKEP